MCGIQIGAQELEKMLAHETGRESAEAGCGVQIGAQELEKILAHEGRAESAEPACGVQIGAAQDVADTSKVERRSIRGKPSATYAGESGAAPAWTMRLAHDWYPPG